MTRPNIVYLHSHDTGRHVSPYGFAVDTPNLQRFAERGVTFRRAFCNNPTCSPSRACLLTGQHAHTNGMMGLTHRGGRITRPERSMPALLRDAGYETVLAGLQHVVPPDEPGAFAELGYTNELFRERRETPAGDFAAGDEATVGIAVDFLRSRASEAATTAQPDPRANGPATPTQTGPRTSGPATPAQEGPRASGAGSAAPFFLDAGQFTTHRTPMPGLGSDDEQWHNGPRPPQGDPRYVRVPAPLPDTPPTRADFADFAASVARLDGYHGAVLDALDAAGLRENTLVIVTTDHGLASPHMKCNLTHHGTGVMLLMAGPGVPAGVVSDALVSHVDLLPTVCRIAGIETPGWVQGRSLLPALDAPEEAAAVNDAVFAEVNHHAAFEPMRSVRTATHSYIRRLDPDRPTHAVLPNIDNSPSKTLLHAAGRLDAPTPDEQLFDLLLDPGEACNRAEDPAYADVLDEMRGRLDAWMRETADPGIDGPPRVPGMVIADPEAYSPSGPTSVVP